MKTKTLLIQLIIVLFSLNEVFCSEIGVPVLLWQQKTSLEADPQLFDSKSTVNQIDGKVLADDYLTNSETIIAFVQKRLSLEQFTTEDERRLTAVKTIFKDKSIKPTLLIDVLNPTEALTAKHFNRQQWDRIDIKNGDKVWIELPEDSLVENNELLAQLMSQIHLNVSKNALFLLTGRQNQFQSIDLESEPLRRHVRAVETQKIEPKDDPKDDERLVRVDNCLYFYTTYVSITNISSEYKPIVSFNTSVEQFEVNNNTSECWDNSHTGYKEAALDMTITNINGTLDLNLRFENKGRKDFWRLRNSTATVTAPKEDGFEKAVVFQLRDEVISAEQNFSYSCSHLNVFSKPANSSKYENLQIIVSFRRFQLQPFKNPTNKEPNQRVIIFTESYDCEVWMTLPLWMGLLTLIVMFIILSTGVYYIAIVNTPDRFENPKGKPLVINAIED